MHQQYGIITHKINHTNLNLSSAELQDMFVATSTLEHQVVLLTCFVHWSGSRHKLAGNNARLILLYKISNNLIDIPINEYITKSNSCTRGKHKYVQPYANKDSYEFSFFPRSVADWNHLPASITSLDKLEKFKTALYVQCATANLTGIHGLA